MPVAGYYWSILPIKMEGSNKIKERESGSSLMLLLLLSYDKGREVRLDTQVSIVNREMSIVKLRLLLACRLRHHCGAFVSFDIQGEDDL